MAVLFGLLRHMGAPPAVYIFIGVLSLVTCLVQMRFGDVPRAASVVAGAVCMPLCTLGTFLFEVFVDHRFDLEDIGWVVFTSPMLAVAGAFFGYLCGACTAGLFLLMDLVEPHLPGGGVSGLRYARPVRSHYVYAEPVIAEVDSPENEVGKTMMAAENPFAPQRSVTEEPPNV
jgi:hypothetical protein